MALLGAVLSWSPGFSRLKPGLQLRTLPVAGLHPSQSRRFHQRASERSEFLNCLRNHRIQFTITHFAVGTAHEHFDPGRTGRQWFSCCRGQSAGPERGGDSAATAVAALRWKIAHRLSGEAMLIEQSVSNPVSPVPVLPLAENPLFDDWLVAIEEYRNARDAEERAAENN